MVFHIPTGKLKTLTKLNNSFVLFSLVNFLCLNKQNVKKNYD